MDAAMVVAKQLNKTPGAVSRAQAVQKAATYVNDPGHPIDLTGTAAGAAKDPRIAAGAAGGGRFGSGGAAAAGAQPKSRAQRKAALLAMAKQDRAKARLLAIRITAMRAALASASGKVSKGQKGSKTTSKRATNRQAPPRQPRAPPQSRPGSRPPSRPPRLRRPRLLLLPRRCT